MFQVDTTASSTATDGMTKSQQNEAKLKDDINQFLQLLVTQLQNQDPLEPMDATQFTQQLVQFASVEQQIYQNSNLEKILDATHSGQVSNLAGFLGKTVEATSDSFNMENGTATFTYDLMSKASTNTLIITDASGKSVFSTKGDVTEGKHEFVWNGKDDTGNQLPDGQYYINVAAQDAGGLPVDYKTTVYGRVTSAGADAGEVSLNMGDVSIPLGMVLTISETPAAVTP